MPFSSVRKSGKILITNSKQGKICLSNSGTLQKQEGCFNPACLPQLQFKDQKQSSCFVHALKNMRVVFET